MKLRTIIKFVAVATVFAGSGLVRSERAVAGQMASNQAGCTVIIQGNNNTVSGTLRCVPGAENDVVGPAADPAKLPPDRQGLVFTVQEFGFGQHDQKLFVDMTVENRSPEPLYLAVLRAQSTIELSNPFASYSLPFVNGLGTCVGQISYCISQSDRIEFAELDPGQPSGFRLITSVSKADSTKGALNLSFLVKSTGKPRPLHISFLNIVIKQSGQ